MSEPNLPAIPEARHDGAIRDALAEAERRGYERGYQDAAARVPGLMIASRKRGIRETSSAILRAVAAAAGELEREAL